MPRKERKKKGGFGWWRISPPPNSLEGSKGLAFGGRHGEGRDLTEDQQLLEKKKKKSGAANGFLVAEKEGNFRCSCEESPEFRTEPWRRVLSKSGEGNKERRGELFLFYFMISSLF